MPHKLLFMKHAFLIMAHNNFEILNALIKVLDDENNDIYIHIDKKSKSFHINKVNRATLIFTNKRYDIRWADESQIRLELYMI